MLVRDPGGKKPPTALLSTDVHLSPAAIVNYFIRRWTIEVTMQEARTHLGVESQRQWSELAIQRSTPCLLALYSITALWADHLHQTRPLEVGQSAWYQKKRPTFSDALAAVRKQIWHQRNICTSEKTDDMIQIPKRLLDELTSILCRAA